MPAFKPLGPTDPTKIASYQVTGRIGEGGQGVVYAAETESGVRVAVKLLHRRFSDDGRVRRAFGAEMRQAQRVRDLRVARVLAYGIHERRLYYASEYVDGPSLWETVERQGPRPANELAELAIATLTALAAIHEAGATHGDFKPGCVLIGPDGGRVIDFGVGRALEAPSRAGGGASPFTAPEYLAGTTPGSESDMFAWAGVMVYSATGRAPFGQDSVPAVINRILNGAPDLSALSGPLLDAVTICLDKNPSRRPTARELLARLQGARLGLGPAGIGSTGLIPVVPIPRPSTGGFPAAEFPPVEPSAPRFPPLDLPPAAPPAPRFPPLDLPSAGPAAAAPPVVPLPPVEPPAPVTAAEPAPAQPWGAYGGGPPAAPKAYEGPIPLSPRPLWPRSGNPEYTGTTAPPAASASPDEMRALTAPGDTVVRVAGPEDRQGVTRRRRRRRRARAIVGAAGGLVLVIVVVVVTSGVLPSRKEVPGVALRPGPAPDTQVTSGPPPTPSAEPTPTPSPAKTKKKPTKAPGWEASPVQVVKPELRVSPLRARVTSDYISYVNIHLKAKGATVRWRATITEGSILSSTKGVIEAGRSTTITAYGTPYCSTATVRFSSNGGDRTVTIIWGGILC
ncbi:serine/threonine protein kinase [Sphaerisporangium fuscum]|uniref:serine/threonine protein kinase n=1 Tax=Sphaerisporangium fuscum TaxID=2835868 RepID=UPI001BDD82B3|nr:serine/threonine-protein kinase [Sphaerisporangium fuscum]